MSYYYDKYEFMGQDSAGFRGGEVEFQVSEFFEPMGMSRRILPWVPRAAMVLAALFRLQSSSCETECNFVCNCMYISMSY